MAIEIRTRLWAWASSRPIRLMATLAAFHLIASPNRKKAHHG